MLACPPPVRSLVLGLCAATLAAQAMPSPDDERVARIYDVGPVLAELAGPLAAVAKSAPDAKALAALVQLIGDFVEPALQPNEHVAALGERWLATVARTEQHAWIDRFLTAAKQPRAQQVQLRCQLFVLPDVDWQRDVAPLLANGRAAAPEVTLLAPGKPSDTFLDAVRKLRNITEVAAPLLVSDLLMPTSIAVTKQTAYVRDFEVEIANGTVIASPTIDVLEHGVTLDGAMLPLGDGRTGLSLHVSLGELLQPIPTFTTKVGGAGADVSIQLPAVQRSERRAAIALRDDETAVVPLPPTTGTRRFATVQLHRFDAAKPR